MKLVLFLVDTRAGRIKEIAPVHYKVTDSTRIRHLETKKFLVSIETKTELTRYLADNLAADLEKDFVVVFDRSCFSNLADLEESLKTYGQEEADTGIVLHAIDVCRRDPFSELTISCSDTDVLLILLNYFEQLPSTTIFKTTEHCYNLRQIFERFTPRVCKALLGFHAFTGSDQTGKFHGFSKRSCWEIFTSSTNETLNAFINLGTNDFNPGIDYCSLESFVVALYRKQKVPAEVATLADLRWYYFSKHQSESHKMPPTYGALHEKILRSHFIALQWKSAHLLEP